MEQLKFSTPILLLSHLVGQIKYIAVCVPLGLSFILPFPDEELGNNPCRAFDHGVSLNK